MNAVCVRSKALKLLATVVCFILVAPSFCQSIVTRLRCENLSSPLGIDAISPRLSWQWQTSEKGFGQSSYQVLVGTDSISLLNQKSDAWNSGEIKSDSALIIYKGAPLQPFTKYYWRVIAKDDKGKEQSNIAIASFETGMMNSANWKGAWISDNNSQQTKEAPYFRSIFSLQKKIKSARAYIAVAGLYELSINGNKVGDHVLDPMYTRFDRRTLYVTYDITSYLRQGQNAVGVLLGNGWYNLQSTAVWFFDKAPWRNRPTFFLDMRITYEDGSVETISSGKEWKTSLSPVVFNSIYTAEHYDSRKEQPGWNTTAFTDSSWHEVIYRTAPSANIVAQSMVPIRVDKVIPAIDCHRFSDTDYVFNIGRNIAGVSEIKISGDSGTVVRLTHGERLDSSRHVDISNIDEHYRPTDDSDPFQTDIFILNGKKDQHFMPRFGYKGFQYVEVKSSQPVTLTKENLTGYFLHSDVEERGTIQSSNETINMLWQAANASYLSNLFGYPTDCPQREKNGWTGDSHIAVETGLYSFDGISVYEKWMADFRDEQQPNGVLPSIVPTDGWGYEWGNGPDWTSSIVLIPWNLYLFYGDEKPLHDCYDNIKRYVDHIAAISPDTLTTWGLGDWVPVTTKPPVEFTSSCYYYADVVILSKAASLFGKNANALYYDSLANVIKLAFNKKYLDAKTAIYGTGMQTEMSMPLYWGLVPAEMKAKVAANLAKRVAQDNYHLNVGLLGQKAILNALSENGYADLAYRIAAQETYPSWGWWIKNGATTLYENWNIKSAHDISLNHIMFGEISAWLYKGIGGIFPDSAQPGFKHVLLKPHFVEGLSYFNGLHGSPYGTIVSNWKRVNSSVEYHVTVPPNANATVYLPAIKNKSVYLDGQKISGSEIDIKSGDYEFVWK